jgi:hypothetical protein
MATSNRSRVEDDRRRGAKIVRAAALALLLWAAVARAGEPRAALDVGVQAEAAVDGTTVAALREMLAARLKEEGWEVVPLDAAPDVVVSLSLEAPDCLLSATLPTASAVRRVRGCQTRTADDRLELVQKATELVRRTCRREETPPPPVEPAPSDPLTVTMAAPRPAPPAAPEVYTGADLRFRAGRVDPVVRVAGRLALEPPWALQIGAGVTEASHDTVTVTEGDLVMALGRRLAEVGRVRIEGSAGAGVIIHRFSATDETGTRFDVLGVAALDVTAPLSRHVGLAMRIAPGISRTEFTHLTGNTVAWSGGRLRLDAGVGLVFF